ncbi:MAG: hypothetical protein Q9227_005946 [Pyrenula ochraceoflavens]
MRAAKSLQNRFNAETADSMSHKRKAVTRDVEIDPAIVPGDEFEIGQLDAELSSSDGSEDASRFDDSVDGDADSAEDGDLNSEEIPSETDSESVDGLKRVAEHDDMVQNAATDSVGEDDKPHYRVVRDANGHKRYLYPEIDPDDRSDESSINEEENTIGNIPLSFYDQYPHVGYNINGKRIMRPATGEALDTLLDSIDVPKGFTGLTDPSTGKPLELNQEELELLRKVQANEIPEEGYNPYEPTIEYFTSKTETMPLSSASEPKRRFVPSKHEAKRVMKIVRAIREGRILPYKPPEEREDEDEDIQRYDIWANEESRPDHPMNVPAPKLPPPSFDESYHPPPEYLPNQTEKNIWNETEPEDRDKEFLPTDHKSLRSVPGYTDFVKEKFERCLDLYLAPRVRRSKLNIDPESLLPKLPSPEELKPFPTRCSLTFSGHTERVRTCAFDPSGDYLATGGDDGTVRVWEARTGNLAWSATIKTHEVINVVRWHPGLDVLILAIAAGDSIHFAIPDISIELEPASEAVLSVGFGAAANPTSKLDSSSTKSPVWRRPTPSLKYSNVHLTIPSPHSTQPPKTLSFHRHGNYVVTLSSSPSTPSRTAIAIHTLSSHRTQYPFTRRLKGGGPPQSAAFHPTKPLLFVANQRLIRAYDLTRQSLVRVISPGARWISSFSIHPLSSSGPVSDNLVIATYDRKLLYHDLDLANTPYKTLRYHDKAIRTVKWHPRLPLFVDGSDDGMCQVFHGQVGRGMMENASVVPLKVLRGHKVKGGVGVMEVDWHPREAVCCSVGGDGKVRIWS